MATSKTYSCHVKMLTTYCAFSFYWIDFQFAASNYNFAPVISENFLVCLSEFGACVKGAPCKRKFRLSILVIKWRAHHIFTRLILPLEKQLSRGVIGKRCSKVTEEHPCRSVISIKLQSNLLYIFRTPFLKNTSGRLLLPHWFCMTMRISCFTVMSFPFDSVFYRRSCLQHIRNRGIFL